MSYFKKYSQLTACIFLMLMWVFPDHISPWNTFLQEAFACIGFALLWGGRSFTLIPIRIYIFLLLLIIISLLQYGLGIISFGDFIFLILVSTYCCMSSSLGALSFVEQRDVMSFGNISKIDIVFLTILFAALINSIVGLAQWQGVEQGMFMYPSKGRVYGNIAQPNQLATLLLMALVSLLYFDINKKVREVWLYSAAAILVFTLVATQSRTGALSITILAVAVFFIKNFRSSLCWISASLLLYWVLYIKWGDISNALGGSAAREFIGLSTTRYKLWEQIYAAISERPLIGWGWLNLGAAQQEFAVSIGGVENMDHAHNLFLDLIIWFGVPVGGIIVLALIFWLWKSLFFNFFVKGNDKSAITAQCAVLLIFPIAIHSMLEYPFAYMYFMLPTVFFMGVVEGDAKFLKIISMWFRKLIWVLVFISLILSVVIGKEYFQIENDFKAALLEENFYTKENELHQYSDLPLILNQYYELVKVLRTTPSSDIDDEDLEIARVISKRFPWLITIRQYYLFLLKLGKCDEAKNQKLIIESLFGRFGVLKADEYSIKYNLNGICN
ncbi:hypothetical protein FZC30_10375 [Comamonas thiooxydans]|nr:hypothetical protein FZC30_10375 [Comamonas thiooxydans]